MAHGPNSELGPIMYYVWAWIAHKMNSLIYNFPQLIIEKIVLIRLNPITIIKQVIFIFSREDYKQKSISL